MLYHTLITSIFNLDSSRACHPSLHKRQKGFTESWGIEDHDDKNKKRSNEHEHPKLILTQHKVAHLEQLYLRIFHIPHIVQNSPYICTESTGPLPYLMDVTLSSSTSSYTRTQNHDDTPDRPPALIGRHHPHHDPTITTAASQSSSSFHPYLSPNSISNSNEQYVKNGSDILTYLQISHHEATIDNNDKEDDKDDPTMTLYLSLIQETLQPILEYKRYCYTNHHDSFQKDAYFKLCMKAGASTSKSPNANHQDFLSLFSTSIFLSPFAAFQYWSTKTLSQSHLQYWNQKCSPSSTSSSSSSSANLFSLSLSSNNSRQSNDSPIHLFQKVKEGYQCLEHYFQTHHFDYSSNRDYRNKPTLLEITLYAHLCDAILDPEFLMILSIHTHLFQWFQSIHIYYFGPGYQDRVISDYGSIPEKNQRKWKFDWITHNNQMNERNVFYPSHVFAKLDSSNSSTSSSSTMTMLEYIQRQLEQQFQSKIPSDQKDDDTMENTNASQIRQQMEQIQNIIQLFSIHHSKNHTYPANSFHRMRLDGPLFVNSNTSASKSSLWKDFFHQEDDDDNPESFHGYLSSKYLQRQKQWYSKYIQRYYNREESVEEEDVPGNTNGKNTSSSSGSSAGEHWMKQQKKLAMEQDQKWMGLVVATAAMVFLITATDGS